MDLQELTFLGWLERRPDKERIVANILSRLSGEHCELLTEQLDNLKYRCEIFSSWRSFLKGPHTMTVTPGMVQIRNSRGLSLVFDDKDILLYDGDNQDYLTDFTIISKERLLADLSWILSDEQYATVSKTLK